MEVLSAGRGFVERLSQEVAERAFQLSLPVGSSGRVLAT